RYCGRVPGAFTGGVGPSVSSGATVPASMKPANINTTPASTISAAMRVSRVRPLFLGIFTGSYWAMGRHRAREVPRRGTCSEDFEIVKEPTGSPGVGRRANAPRRRGLPRRISCRRLFSEHVRHEAAVDQRVRAQEPKSRLRKHLRVAVSSLAWSIAR